jgi:transcriptional regulator with XRE-family HTH domain
MTTAPPPNAPDGSSAAPVETGPRRSALSGNLLGVNEAERWLEFGRFLTDRRHGLALKRRDAAKRAKLSEATWRALELGYQTSYGGVRVLPNPTPDALRRVAEALELPADQLLERVGPRVHRPLKGGVDDAPNPLTRKIAALSKHDQQLVELLVDRMLDRD